MRLQDVILHSPAEFVNRGPSCGQQPQSCPIVPSVSKSYADATTIGLAISPSELLQLNAALDVPNYDPAVACYGSYQIAMNVKSSFRVSKVEV